MLLSRGSSNRNCTTSWSNNQNTIGSFTIMDSSSIVVRTYVQKRETKVQRKPRHRVIMNFVWENAFLTNPWMYNRNTQHIAVQYTAGCLLFLLQLISNWEVLQQKLWTFFCLVKKNMIPCLPEYFSFLTKFVDLEKVAKNRHCAIKPRWVCELRKIVCTNL